MSGVNQQNSKLDITSLNRQITINSISLARDTLGGNSKTLVPVFTGVWANIYNMRGKTVYAFRQLEAQVEYMITIRFRTGVTPKMVVTYGSSQYSVQRVIDVDNKHEWLQMYCQDTSNVGV